VNASTVVSERIAAGEFCSALSPEQIKIFKIGQVPVRALFLSRSAKKSGKFGSETLEI